MARGWESKSIEEQQAAYIRSPSATGTSATPERAAQKRLRDGLELSRKRVLEQMRVATHPNHRKLLEDTLAELQGQLARLPKP